MSHYHRSRIGTLGDLERDRQVVTVYCPETRQLAWLVARSVLRRRHAAAGFPRTLPVLSMRDARR
jgi:hypothetical protein